MSKLIAAYTPPTSPYPPFVNISREDDGAVRVLVRGPPGPGPYSNQDCGPDVAITLSAEAWDELRTAIIGAS